MYPSEKWGRGRKGFSSVGKGTLLTWSALVPPFTVKSGSEAVRL